MITFYAEECNSSLMDESNASSLGILSPSLIEKHVGYIDVFQYYDLSFYLTSNPVDFASEALFLASPFGSL